MEEKTDPRPPADPKAIFECASDVRKFEIGLFWTRSLFFWGFIGAAFIAYASLIDAKVEDRDLSLVVACFGFVCSVAWSLVNRGSKYWQEYWEHEVELVEEEVLGYKLFGKDGAVQDKGTWLSARKYSVSKLAIALSDFVALVWLFLIAKAVPWITTQCQPNWSIVLPMIAIAYVGLMLWRCRTTPRAP